MSADIKLLTFGKFLGGQNTRLEPDLLGPDEAQATADVDMQSGALTGTPDVGIAVAQDSSYPNARWIWFSGSGKTPSVSGWDREGVWQWANETRFAMRDGDVSYCTRAGLRPAIIDGLGIPYPLGVLPPENVAYSTSGAGSLTGSFAYGISYKTADGFESNIQNYPIILTLSSNVLTFSAIWPADVRITKVSLWRAAITAGVVGTYYRLASVTDRNITTLVDDGTENPTTEPLTWTYGGYPGNDGTVVASIYTSDHAPAPSLTCLADRVHAMASGLTAISGGIVIGAVGNVLRWSQNGFPLYWPSYAEEILDRPVEAIIVHTGYSVVFTSGGMYALSGAADSAMSNRRLDSSHPIRRGWGKSAIMTSYGTIYVSRDGLAAFDGARGRLISQFKLPRTYFDSLTLYDAGFYDDRYYIFHSGGQLIVDLKDGLDRARFSESDTVIRCVTATDFRSPIIADPVRAFPGNDVRESVSAAITGNSSAQWIAVSSTTSFSVGQQVQVANGTNSFQVVTIQAISGSSVYGVFSTTHAAGATISGGDLLGRRRFGFVSDNSTKLFLVGGTQLNVASATESPVSTAFVYDTATSSATWQAAGTMAGVRADIAAVLVGSTLYAYGGTSNAGESGQANISTMQAYGTVVGTWSTDSTASGPGSRKSYAAASDVSGGNTSNFWLQGGHDGANVVATGYQYTISPAAWATITTTGAPSLMNHAMAYVEASAFSDSHARLMVFAGATGTAVATGTDIIYAYDFTAGTWSNDSSSDGTNISSAMAAGVAKRSRHVWKYAPFSKKIFLHGGISTDGTALADLWEFDPVVWAAATGAKVAAWVNSTGIVVNVEDRYWHGGAFINPYLNVNTNYSADRLYLAGGSSSTNPYQADMSRVVTGDLENQQTTAGLYVLKNSDTGIIRLLRGGGAQQWDWQTGDYLGDNPASYKWAQKAFVDYRGTVNLAAASDNGSVTSMLTLTSTTRAQTAVWLPLATGTAAKGKRLSFRFRGGASSVSKSTNNTLVSISSYTAGTAGSYTLQIVRATGPTFTITYNGTAAPGNPYSGWPAFPVTITDTTAGTIVLADSGGPLMTNGTYSDTVTVADAAKLWSASFEMCEEANN